MIYTGGTIGMVRNDEGVLSCAPNALEKMIRNTITMHDEKYSALRFNQVCFTPQLFLEWLLSLVTIFSEFKYIGSWHRFYPMRNKISVHFLPEQLRRKKCIKLIKH